VAQVVEYLLSKLEALSSNPRIANKQINLKEVTFVAVSQFFFFFETRSCWVAQAVLELMTLLLQSSKCLGDRHTLPQPAHSFKKFMSLKNCPGGFNQIISKQLERFSHK
jgi:hypothetical protein